MKKTIIAFLICLCTFSLKAGIQLTTVADSTVKSPEPIEGQNTFEIDFNNDGVTDISISAKFFLHNDGPHPPYKSNIVEVDSTALNKVNCGPFTSGDIIDDNLSYCFGETIFGGIPGIGGVGKWYLRVENVDTYAYIGVKFYVSGNAYYAWVKLKTNAYTFTIDSFAYNDIPSQPISAGQME